MAAKGSPGVTISLFHAILIGAPLEIAFFAEAFPTLSLEMVLLGSTLERSLAVCLSGDASSLLLWIGATLSKASWLPLTLAASLAAATLAALWALWSSARPGRPFTETFDPVHRVCCEHREIRDGSFDGI